MLNKVAVQVALLAAGAIVASSASANADLLQIQQSAQISAPVGKVWSIVKNFGDLTWVPLVKQSAATDANTVGSIRTLDLGGAKLTEELVGYNAAAHTYTYAIQNTESNQQVAPVSDAVSTITVTPSKNGSLVTWKASFRRVDRAEPAADGRDDKAAQTAFGGVISTGLKALTKEAQIQ